MIRCCTKSKSKSRTKGSRRRGRLHMLKGKPIDPRWAIALLFTFSAIPHARAERRKFFRSQLTNANPVLQQER